jgi:hypothetical protein
MTILRAANTCIGRSVEYHNSRMIETNIELDLSSKKEPAKPLQVPVLVNEVF